MAGWLPGPRMRRGAGPQPRGGPRVCLLLAVRSGPRGPSVPRPWTAWPRPDLLRRAGSRRSVQLVEACSSTNTRQIPTLIIPSTRILAVAPTYLISLTPSSENHVPLNYMSPNYGESRPYILGVRIDQAISTSRTCIDVMRRVHHIESCSS